MGSNERRRHDVEGTSDFCGVWLRDAVRSRNDWVRGVCADGWSPVDGSQFTVDSPQSEDPLFAMGCTVACETLTRLLGGC